MRKGKKVKASSDLQAHGQQITVASGAAVAFLAHVLAPHVPVHHGLVVLAVALLGLGGDPHVVQRAGVGGVLVQLARLAAVDLVVVAHTEEATDLHEVRLLGAGGRGGLVAVA